ncbi:MAG TPA: sulfatase-like hydrolase/transferase [Polyangia bacterium]|nr:sulfatase-like hydrolase/transferase [Polyangia bacterium]
MLDADAAADRNERSNRGRVWLAEGALVAAVLLEAFLPARAFGLRLSAPDAAILTGVVASGLAIVRGGYSLLATWLPRRAGLFAAPALLVATVAVVAIGGMWHGPPHYALVTATALGLSSVGFLSWFAAPGAAAWRRLTGALTVAMAFAFILVLVDLNALSLFPRHVPVLAAIIAVTWLAGALAIMPPLPAARARQILSLGGVTATLCLVLAPATTARVAGYLRRQSELGALLAPVSWVRGVSADAYLTWGNDLCPSVPQRPVMVAGRPNGLNVLFITIDTLRRDLYLPAGQTMAAAYPNLAAVAKDGCQYQNVRSVGASTHLAMPALYNGTLAWTTMERPLLSALADRAQMHGRVFGGLWQISKYAGLPDGAGGGDEKTSVTTRIVAEMRLASDEGRPWMLVAHYLTLHLPRKAELLSQFSGDLRPVYAHKLAGLDAELGQLFAAIKARGECDRTAIIITADHGEELNERGYSEHAFHLYDTVLAVPLIARLPGQACLDPQTPLTLLDVGPMLATALGLEVQSSALQGHWPPTPSQPVYAFSTVGGPFMAIIDGNLKTIVDARYGDTEVYDLDADPQEKRDLSAGLTPIIAARLTRAPIPWNPLVPMAQRYRHAGGTEYDVCPGKITPQPARQATVQAAPMSPPRRIQASRL